MLPRRAGFFSRFMQGTCGTGFDEIVRVEKQDDGTVLVFQSQSERGQGVNMKDRCVT